MLKKHKSKEAEAAKSRKSTEALGEVPDWEADVPRLQSLTPAAVKKRAKASELESRAVLAAAAATATVQDKNGSFAQLVSLFACPW